MVVATSQVSFQEYFCVIVSKPFEFLHFAPLQYVSAPDEQTHFLQHFVKTFFNTFKSTQITNPPPRAGQVNAGKKCTPDLSADNRPTKHLRKATLEEEVAMGSFTGVGYIRDLNSRI